MDKDIIEKTGEDNNNPNKKTFSHYLFVALIVIVSLLLSFLFVPLIVIVISFSLSPESRQSEFGAALYDAGKVLMTLILIGLIGFGLCTAVVFIGFNGY
jgi:uncharacterized protein YqhQ